MSNPQTFYTTVNPNGHVLDLSNIFQPIGGATPGPSTGYITWVSGVGTDLSDIFAPNVGTFLSYDTGLQVNGTDLRYVFAPRPSSAFVTNGVVSTSTNYTFVTFTNTTSGSCAITFTTTNNVLVNYLLVGGGGSGGAGGSGLTAFGDQVTCGGGGEGGYVVNANFNALPNVPVTATVGAGGTCINYTPSNGGSTSITQNNNITVTAGGGHSGNNADFTNTTTNIPGGISNPLQAGGQGGNGGNLGISLSSSFDYPGTVASNYNTTYQNFTVDSVNLGTFSGSGGGGNELNSATSYTGQGGGGAGGYYYAPNPPPAPAFYPPVNGTNGGGGGGGSTSFISQTAAAFNQAGASGGNGIVILWFSNNIS